MSNQKHYIKKIRNKGLNWEVLRKFGDIVVVMCEDEAEIRNTEVLACLYEKKTGLELKKIFKSETMIAYKLVGEKREEDNEA